MHSVALATLFHGELRLTGYLYVVDESTSRRDLRAHEFPTSLKLFFFMALADENETPVSAHCVGVDVDEATEHGANFEISPAFSILRHYDDGEADMFFLRPFHFSLGFSDRNIEVTGWYPATREPSENVSGLGGQKSKREFLEASEEAWKALELLRGQRSPRGRPPRVTVEQIEQARQELSRLGDIPTQEAVAAKLNIDRRTLQRALRRHRVKWRLN